MNSDQLWDRYEAVLEKYHPLGYKTLRPAATEDEIKKAEQAMGVRFPKDLKDAYRRHNGTLDGGYSTAWVLFLSAANWACLDSVVSYWQMKVHVNEANDDGLGLSTYSLEYLQSLAIRPYWWHRKWMPIGQTATATSVFIDMNPGPRGKNGQLIYNSGDGVGGTLEAPSLNAWIEFQCDCFESGRFYARQDTGEVFDRTLGGRSGMAAGVYYTDRSPHH